MNKKHMYHLMDKSSWPLMSSFAAMNFVISLELCMQKIENSFYLFIFCFIVILGCMFGWWRDVISEGTYLNEHTYIVQSGLKLGFILFMLSEVMVFFALFWSFFHYSLSPAMELGNVWPPMNMMPLEAFSLPLVNTLMLLWSGFTVTVAHIGLKILKYDLVLKYLFLTMFLGMMFMVLQGYEYFNATFNMTDSVYGSIFFGLTGMHGLHVIIGVLFLFVCYISIWLGHFNSEQHLGFDFAVWYWHFVDVIWIIVFIVIYCWGNWTTM